MKRSLSPVARRSLAMTLALPLAGGAVGSAQAADGPTCNGYSGYATVTGTLTVPESGYCRLDHVTINGNVVVAKHANLVILSSTVHGSVKAGDSPNYATASTGYYNSWNTTVDGDVRLRNLWGAYISESRIGGTLFSDWPSEMCGHGECTSSSTIYVGDGTRAGGLSVDHQKAVIRRAVVTGATSMFGGTIDADQLTTGTLTAQSSSTYAPPPNNVVMGRSTVTGATLLKGPFGGGNFVLGSADGTVAPNTLGSLTVDTPMFRPHAEIIGNTVNGLASWPSEGLYGNKDWTIRDNRFLGGAEGVFARQPVSPQTTASLAARRSTTAQHRSAKELRAESKAAVKELKARQAEVERTARAHGKAPLR